MATDILNLPEIAADQAQKHVTHNDALALLDALVPAVVASATTTAAPGSPTEGEAYIVPTGGTFGSVAEDHVAVWVTDSTGGSWRDIPGVFGMRVAVLDEGRHRINAGSRGWVPGQVIGDQGGTLGLRAIDFSATLDASTQTTIVGAIPTRAIILGVTSWVETEVTGPSMFKVGISGELDKFGGSLALAAGASNIGVVGPFATYSPADLLITSQDETTAFTGGVVNVSVLIAEPGAAPV